MVKGKLWEDLPVPITANENKTVGEQKKKSSPVREHFAKKTESNITLLQKQPFPQKHL